MNIIQLWDRQFWKSHCCSDEGNVSLTFFWRKPCEYFRGGLIRSFWSLPKILCCLAIAQARYRQIPTNATVTPVSDIKRTFNDVHSAKTYSQSQWNQSDRNAIRLITTCTDRNAAAWQHQRTCQRCRLGISIKAKDNTQCWLNGLCCCNTWSKSYLKESW